jgi:uncharacterized protein
MKILPHSALILTMIALGIAASAQTIQVNKDNRTIAITTSDQAEAVADVAVVTVGFTSFGTDQDQTYADASRISNSIIKALRDAGNQTGFHCKRQSKPERNRR